MPKTVTAETHISGVSSRELFSLLYEHRGFLEAYVSLRLSLSLETLDRCSLAQIRTLPLTLNRSLSRYQAKENGCTDPRIDDWRQNADHSHADSSRETSKARASTTSSSASPTTFSRLVEFSLPVNAPTIVIKLIGGP